MLSSAYTNRHVGYCLVTSHILPLVCYIRETFSTHSLRFTLPSIRWVSSPLPYALRSVVFNSRKGRRGCEIAFYFPSFLFILCVTNLSILTPVMDAVAARLRCFIQYVCVWPVISLTPFTDAVAARLLCFAYVLSIVLLALYIFVFSCLTMFYWLF